MSHTLPFVLILAAIILIASSVAQLVVGRVFKHSFLREHHGMVEPLFGVVGTLYSVLLGFMVGGAMDRYEDCIANVDREANSMTNVFRLAQGFHKEDRVRIRKLCRSYALEVVEREWPQMRDQNNVNGAFQSYQALWEAALSVQPEDDERITNIQQAMLDSLNDMAINRRLRIVAAHQGVSIPQWLVVGVGSAITVLFCLLFPIRQLSFQAFLTGLVSVSLGLNIWLLAEYSSPFTGELAIRPYIFTLNVQNSFKRPDTPSRYLDQVSAQR
jgi:hypothetical protein